MCRPLNCGNVYTENGHRCSLLRPSRNSQKFAATLKLLAKGNVNTKCLPAIPKNSAEEYNASMRREMGWDKLDPYQYHPERGLYYHEVWQDLFCGSQPQKREDIDALHCLLGPRGTILCLQQDKDLEYWSVNLQDLLQQARQHGLVHLRQPAQDFDPHSLRSILPRAVRMIDAELQSGQKVYVHCTAGLGRAPAACIAYLYWFHNFQLEAAYNHLTKVRPCGPKKDAIRGATYDLLDSRSWEEFNQIPDFSYSELNVHDKTRLRDKLSHL